MKTEKEPRIIGLQAREHHEALQGARRAQTTEEFRSRYAARAGNQRPPAEPVV